MSSLGREGEMVSEGLMRVAEAARFLSVSRAHLYALMDRGELPWVKLGRARRIPRAAVIRLAATNVRGGYRSFLPGG
jgi:excisionase family DNA binding protein